MNLAHFCDPDRNHFKDANWSYHKGRPEIEPTWPEHNMCKGEEILDYGTKREQVVKCDCKCHEVRSK